MMMMMSTESQTGDHPLPHPDHPNLEEKNDDDDETAAAATSSSSSSSLMIMDTHRYSPPPPSSSTTTVLTIDVGCLNEEEQEIPPKASSSPLPDQLPFDNNKCNSNSHNQ